jgi:hypothetical protein
MIRSLAVFCLLALLAAPAVSQPVLPFPIPLAYYSFDGQSLNDTNIVDKSGNGSTLQLENGMALRDSNCKFGQCVSTGSSNSARGLLPASLDFGQFGGAVAMWVLIFTVNDYDRILVKARGNTPTTFQILFHNVNAGANETAADGEQFQIWRYKIRANVTDAMGTFSRDYVFNSSAAAPWRNVWHHVAFHFGPISAKIYIDGTLAQRIMHSQVITYNPDTSQPFVLGNNPALLGDRKLFGRIDELRFFRNERSDQELSANFVQDVLLIDPGTPAPTPEFQIVPAPTLLMTPTTTLKRTSTTTTTPPPPPPPLPTPPAISTRITSSSSTTTTTAAATTTMVTTIAPTTTTPTTTTLTGQSESSLVPPTIPPTATPPDDTSGRELTVTNTIQGVGTSITTIGIAVGVTIGVLLMVIAGLVAYIAVNKRQHRTEQSAVPLEPAGGNDARAAPNRNNYEALVLNQRENNYGEVIGAPNNYVAWSEDNNYAKALPNRTDYEQFTNVH